MPLSQGTSSATRQSNVAEMVRSGHKPTQAVAAAYAQQRQSRARMRRMKGKRHKASRYALKPMHVFKQLSMIRMRKGVTESIKSLFKKAVTATKKAAGFHKLGDYRHHAPNSHDEHTAEDMSKYHLSQAQSHAKAADEHWDKGTKETNKVKHHSYYNAWAHHKAAHKAHLKAAAAYLHKTPGGSDQKHFSISMSLYNKRLEFPGFRLYTKSTPLNPHEMTQRAVKHSEAVGDFSNRIHNAEMSSKKQDHSRAAEHHKAAAKYHQSEAASYSQMPMHAGEYNDSEMTEGHNAAQLHKRAANSHKIAAQAHEWAALTKGKKQQGRFNPAQMSTQGVTKMANSQIHEIKRAVSKHGYKHEGSMRENPRLPIPHYFRHPEGHGSQVHMMNGKLRSWTHYRSDKDGSGAHNSSEDPIENRLWEGNDLPTLTKHLEKFHGSKKMSLSVNPIYDYEE